MLTQLAVASLVLTLAAGDASPVVGGKAAAAARLARTETDACLASCPPLPAQPTSDWLRSPEGRKINACPMNCRVEQPAAALFRSLADLATSNKPDAEAPIIKAAGREGPELLRRLRAALREAEGQKLGPLCTRARANLRPADEAVYVECTGRVPAAEAAQGLVPPDATRAPRCAVAFAERDHEWLKRCDALEAKVDPGLCVEQSGGGRRQAAAAAAARCENDAVDRLASAFPPRRHP
jgi:hypothetical protein